MQTVSQPVGLTKKTNANVVISYLYSLEVASDKSLKDTSQIHTIHMHDAVHLFSSSLK